MTDSADQVLDELAADLPQYAPILSSLTDVVANLFGPALYDSGFVDVFIDTDDSAVLIEVSFVADPLVLALPNFGGFSVSVGEADEFELELVFLLNLSVAKCIIYDTPIFVRCIDSGLLTPVTRVDDAWQPDRDGDGNIKSFGLVFSGLSLTFDSTGAFDATTEISVDAPPTRIGNSGVVVEMKGLKPCLSDAAVLPAGVPAGSRGFAIDSVEVYLPDSLKGTFAPGEIMGEGLFLGTGGFTGKLSALWPAGKPIEFGGSTCTLKSLLLDFKQNSLVDSKLECAMTLPFFDAPVDVEIAIGMDGGFSVALSNTTTGLKTLHIANVLDIELDSLGFDVKDGVLDVKLGGKLTPTFGGLNWPSFDVKELRIDSEGHVALDGGWIDLPKQYSLDFHGFKVDITKFGLGRNEDGTKWYGVSGGVELVKGLPAGASVKGLRVTTDENWGNAKLSFEGVGVEFEVPGVFQFKGEVDYREIPAGVHRFDGDITLKLESIDLEIDGTLVAGSAQGYNFFALYIHVALPEGIPWGSLPFAFFGFGGLLALNMGPDKLPADPWYGLADGEGWYKKQPVGVEKLEKWKNIKGNRAFGAAVDLGTYEDDGYLFNGRVLLAIILPGPVVCLQGFFNLLKDRSALGDNAMFRTIAVYDKPAGTLLFGVDAEYKYDEASGDLIDIHGGLEAFYDFNDPTGWFIHLGEDTPRQNRIQARVLSMFDANAYFMLDAHKLAMGSWIGYAKSWHFSKLSVALEAWMENNAVVSFKPAHLHAGLCMHGSVELKVLKFGLGLNVDALIEADVAKPFHLLGDFSVSIDLPKPLKDISANVSMEWGPRPDEPPLPIAFKEAAIGHFKSSVTWPLPLGSLVLPSYDAGGGFLGAASSATNDFSPPPAALPVVPVDCRPTITFARDVWDDARIAATVQLLDPPLEQIGDPVAHQGPAKVRYALRSAQLDKYDGSSWTTIAAASGGVTANPKLFGSWSASAALGGTGPGQSKLTLWSLSGLDHFRNTSADWGTRFAARFPSYPCGAPPRPSHACLSFDNLRRYGFYEAPFRHPDHSGVTIGLPDAADGSVKPPPRADGASGEKWQDIDQVYWKEDYEEGGALFPGQPPGFIVYTTPPGISEHRQELCPLVGSAVTIDFAAPANDLRITVAGRGADPVTAYAIDAQGVTFGPFSPVDGVVIIPVAEVLEVKLGNGDNVCLVEICGMLAPPQELADAYADGEAHNQSAALLWSGTGNVLEPFTRYRLRIATNIAPQDYAYDPGYNIPRDQVQYAYFQTSGPPGIGSPSVPVNADADNFDTGLDDLSRYVEQTVPPTVPAKGQKPLSPRPVYRGYDANVVFNENYVSLMYRMAGRDLSLLLYDRNNRPVRSLAGRLMVADNPWDAKPIPTLSASDQQWTAMLNASGCVTVDVGSIPADQIIAAGAEEQILDRDALYEARLVPSLLHEDFARFAIADSAQGSGARLGRWQVADQAAMTGGPSRWDIEPAGNGALRVAQNAAVLASNPGDGEPAGTLLAAGDFPGLAASDTAQPAQWSDVRLGLTMRSSQGTAIGAAFRYVDAANHYLFVMDALASQRRLVRVQNGVATVLKQDAVAYASTTDYRVVIEALGPALRVYVDDAPIFDAEDAAIAGGGVALYCSGGAGAAFSEIQVHDFSVHALCVYKYSFTTSPFVDFRHHLHSFEDGCWKLQSAMPDAGFSALVQSRAPSLAAPLGDAEARAFESLAGDVLGQQSLQASAKVEITRIERAGRTCALLVRGPQPFGFARDGFDLQSAAADMPVALSPLGAKIAGAKLRAASPAQEEMTVMLLEPTDTSGWRIEKRAVPVGGVPVALDDPASQWSTVFQFPAMLRLSDGTRISIFSCGPDAAPPRSLRGEQRFRAAAGDPGSLALDADAVDLRLVSADGEVIHARRFLADAAYLAVPGCTFLRKADETAFVVVPPGSDFAPGSYRANMTYRLDNTANDSGSIVLSQAGDSTPESACVDFAWTPFGA